MGEQKPVETRIGAPVDGKRGVGNEILVSVVGGVAGGIAGAAVTPIVNQVVDKLKPPRKDKES